MVALGRNGWPHSRGVCERLLNGRRQVPLTLIVFDLLELDPEDTTGLPYRERRWLLAEQGDDRGRFRYVPSCLRYPRKEIGRCLS